ncbi:MAG: NAD(P)-dependent oxidoreductase [Actinobacteria bacterium]|nr:NAD(P)-dependent oxidoreductase [Actinomycetota bacterium]
MAELTIGIVSPGAMGSAVGRAYAAGGARVVATVAGRSGRTRELAHGLELLPDLDEVVRLSDMVLSIVPPEHAAAVAADIGAAARRADADPLVADLNAIAPGTARSIQTKLAGSGLDLVDGSISGGPPHAGGSTRIYLSGGRATELAALPAPGIDARIVGPEIGAASAVKMSTASVYKGTVGLLAHALLAADANGVLPHVLDDLRESYPELVERAASSIGRAATKADRYAGEMREIAATQAAAGLPPELFDGFAALYAALARSRLAQAAPESIGPETRLEDVLAALSAEGAARTGEAGPRRAG